jgi:hypothetical protein
VAASAKLVHEVLQSSDLELAEYDSANLQKVDLSDVKNTIVHLGAKYIDFITEEIINQDLKSSGDLERSLQLTELSETGGIYSVGIKAAEYASYLDEGVNGWAIDRGSRFSYRTRGVDPGGEMVKSVKAWIQREGASARNVSRAVTAREAKGKTMMDASTRAAVTASYFIKRNGLKPRRFWSEATDEFKTEMENELGIALKIDIINCITK